MSATFTASDPAALAAVGYVVRPLLGDREIDALARAATEHVPRPLDRFWSASRDPDKQLRRAVHEAVLAVLREPLLACFPDYRPVLCSLVAKPGGTAAGAVPLHQDWSFVDDGEWVSLNVWCPLEDVDEQNGCLQVVPASHRAARQPRAAGAPFAFESIEPVLRRHLRSVPVRAGQALFFDHCLIHCSPPNRTRSVRTAATAALVPRAAPLRYYHQAGPDAEVRAFEVSDDVHLWHDPGDLPPQGRVVEPHRIGLTDREAGDSRPPTAD